MPLQPASTTLCHENEQGLWQRLLIGKGMMERQLPDNNGPQLPYTRADWTTKGHAAMMNAQAILMNHQCTVPSRQDCVHSQTLNAKLQKHILVAFGRLFHRGQFI